MSSSSKNSSSFNCVHHSIIIAPLVTAVNLITVATFRTGVCCQASAHCAACVFVYAGLAAAVQPHLPGSSSVHVLPTAIAAFTMCFVSIPTVLQFVSSEWYFAGTAAH
jgi:hypothetical protein